MNPAISLPKFRNFVMFNLLRNNSLIGISLLLMAIPASSAEMDFAHDVMPIIKEHCAKCHTGEKVKGGLAITSRAELLRGGDKKIGRTGVYQF